MEDAERLELDILRKAIKKFGGCAISVRYEQGWVSRLLRDEVRDAMDKAGLLDKGKEPPQ